MFTEAGPAWPAGVPIWVSPYALNFNRPGNHAQRPTQLHQAAESRQPSVDRVGCKSSIHEVRFVIECQSVRLSRTPGQEQVGSLLKGRSLDECLEVFEVLAVGGDGFGFSAIEKCPQQAGGS
jgi:hypothetical protein